MMEYCFCKGPWLLVGTDANWCCFFPMGFHSVRLSNCRSRTSLVYRNDWRTHWWTVAVHFTCRVRHQIVIGSEGGLRNIYRQNLYSIFFQYSKFHEFWNIFVKNKIFKKLHYHTTRSWGWSPHDNSSRNSFTLMVLRVQCVQNNFHQSL